MEGQIVKKRKFLSEREKQLYDKVDSKILAAIQGNNDYQLKTI